MNRKAYFLPMLIFGLVLLGCVSKEEHASTPQLQTPQLQTEQKQVYNKADKIEHKELKPENIHFSEGRVLLGHAISIWNAKTEGWKTLQHASV